MKRRGLIVVLLMLVTAFAFGQNMEMAEGTHYRVFSEAGKVDAQAKADFLDAFFNLYNSYFHFKPASLSGKMTVRIFSDKGAFDNYLNSLVSETRDTYVYLQYKEAGKSELAGYVMEDKDAERRSLIHHGFVQFLRSFVKEPPLWLQKGFAIYFEKSTYDADRDAAIYRENLEWAPYLRTLLRKESESEGSSGLLPLNSLLYVDAETANANIDPFYAESWGLVSFLVNSEFKNYNRVLWDAISSLSMDADKRENETAVVKAAFEWTDRNQFISDFASYAASIKTFPDLIEIGMNAYGLERYAEAEDAFVSAMMLRPDSYIPYYYLGLIGYAGGDYSSAEYYYHSAIKVGGSESLAYYALGVNAYADNRSSDAAFYLNQVKDLDPDGFGAKAETLLARINTESGSETPADE